MANSNDKKIDVVVAGHICFDVIPRFPKTGAKSFGELFVPGKLVNVGDVVTSTGGPVSNTGLGLHRLGAKVELMAKIGDDFLGKAILDKLKETISVAGMHIVPGEQSSYTLALAPPGIDRIFLHNPGANNTFGLEDINFDLVKQARIFHLGYPPLMRRLYENEGAELARIFKKAKETGVTTSLDVSLPDPASESGKQDWDKILKNVLPFVDIYLPSVEETCFMIERDRFMQFREDSKDKDLLDCFEGEDMSRMSARLMSYGPKIVSLKSGFRGFYLRTAGKKELEKMGWTKPADLDNWAGRELWEPSYRVEEVASATGAGDSAIAGFLSAYLNGKSVEVSLKYACAVGAQNVRVLDAVSGIKSWKETTEQVESKPPKNKLTITTKGWEYHEKEELWSGPNDKKTN